MWFIVDKQRKVIFGWSAKCGCSHVKRLYKFLKNKPIDGKIHTITSNKCIPDDIEKYTTILISRDPYKRLVSGFLDKYRKNGPYRHMWKHDNITFSKFVDELIKNDWKMVEKHHFTPQTSEKFDMRVMLSRCIKCYDIESIDYSYIETLYNVNIPEEFKSKKEGHERKKYELTIEEPVYDVDMSKYYEFNVDSKYFYSEELKNKVYSFYENDFVFFSERGLSYNKCIM
jgi:hypothetical protein